MSEKSKKSAWTHSFPSKIHLIRRFNTFWDTTNLEIPLKNQKIQFLVNLISRFSNLNWTALQNLNIFVINLISIKTKTNQINPLKQNQDKRPFPTFWYDNQSSEKTSKFYQKFSKFIKEKKESKIPLKTVQVNSILKIIPKSLRKKVTCELGTNREWSKKINSRIGVNSFHVNENMSNNNFNWNI